MANKLTDELESLVQRSGTNTGSMRTEAERASFSINVRKDIASIVYQLNVVHQELVKTLSSEDGANALDLGLSGNVIYTHVTATEADAEAYYSVDQARARTIKETIDVLLAEIARLENELQAALDSSEYDDAELRSLIQGNSLDLLQLAKDTMGPDYVLDGDGEANLTYSLSQAIDAIGVFFAGFPGTGNSYSATYPTLALSVLLSEVIIDITLAQTTVTGLPADLGYIRSFIGMTTSGPEMPGYSAWGSTAFVVDGWSLERAIAILDTKLGAHASRHERLGADQIDGDHLDINFVPTNYTRTTDALAIHVQHLTSHLKGIDAAIAAAGEELEVGHSVVRANDFKTFSSQSGPTHVIEEYGTHPTGFVAQTLDFDPTVLETAYATTPIPMDEDGNMPSRFRAVAHLVPKPKGGAYPGGTGIAFELHIPNAVSKQTIGDGVLFPPASYAGPTVVTDATLGAGSIDKLIVLDFGITTLASNPLGLLNLRFNRAPVDPVDDWGNYIGLIVMHIIWYR